MPLVWLSHSVPYKMTQQCKLEKNQNDMTVLSRTGTWQQDFIPGMLVCICYPRELISNKIFIPQSTHCEEGVFYKKNQHCTVPEIKHSGCHISSN